MFDYIQKHKKIVQILMALLIIPFAFTGVTGVLSDTTGTSVLAKVGAQDITQRMFDVRYEDYKTQTRNSLGDKFDAAAFDTLDNRQAFLNEMVDEVLVGEAVRQEHLSVSDAFLAQALMSNAQIPKDAQGKIDFVAYDKYTRTQYGVSTAQYEAQMRGQMASAAIEQAASSGQVVLPLQQDYLQKLFSKVQLIEQKAINPAEYLSGIQLDSTKVKAYYDANQVKFNRPAAFDVAYALIPVPALPSNYVPTDADIKATFGANATAADITSVRADPIKVKQAFDKAAAAKMEETAKKIIEATAGAPKDLEALVKQFGGKIETAQGVTRAGAAHLPMPLQSSEVREMLTSAEMGASNQIGSPVAYDANHLLVGRVLKSTEAGLQSFDTVRAEIENKLKQELAMSKIREAAQTSIASMSPAASIGQVVPVGVLLKHSVSPEALAQILAVKDYPKLIVSSGDAGVSIVRVVGAGPAVAAEQAQLKQQISGWQSLGLELQRRAFLQHLRQKYKVKVFTERLKV